MASSFFQDTERPALQPAAAPSDRKIGGLGAALVGLDVELDLLAFVQAAQARRFHGRDMDKHVLAAIVGRDEAKTFCAVEEFYGATRHCRSFTSLRVRPREMREWPWQQNIKVGGRVLGSSGTLE